jgi:uncharacterized metal-binding protein YceD (DUF177 family)
MSVGKSRCGFSNMLKINLRHLEEHGLHLKGELSAVELDLGIQDELIRVEEPLRYDLSVELLDDAILVTGKLVLPLDCECSRCLKKFATSLKITDWAVHLPLEGEDKVAVDNDCVDLTPFMREDILLDFPQHPLCKPDCAGLKTKSARKAKTVEKPVLDVWAKLDKLKLK